MLLPREGAAHEPKGETPKEGPEGGGPSWPGGATKGQGHDGPRGRKGQRPTSTYGAWMGHGGQEGRREV